ncbi:MAG: FHA domain-containing protein [Geitlerinemataceae cyanobacterium]
MTQKRKIRLSWEDPVTGQQRESLLSAPIALGRLFGAMPDNLDGRHVSRVVFDNDDRVSRYHALIDFQQNHWIIIDRNSGNGTFVNGVRRNDWVLASGDVLQIGDRVMTITFSLESSPNSAIPFDPKTGLLDPHAVLTPNPYSFPPSEFRQAEFISEEFLQNSGIFNPQTDRFDYAAIGAGLGSYIWVDFLRIFGVRSSQIVALGTQPQPYAKYKQLCLNSQIPLYERLRSNSDSCPDNIWGWPGYALREAWHDLGRGKLGNALKYLWQVFAEPTFAETYTPRASNIFASIDREAARIGWDRMYRYGSVRAIRKTQEGGYAIAYSRGKGNYGYIVAKHIHLATGYPAIRFLPHLQTYREQTRDLTLVVNAYEPHDYIYQNLGMQGGTVLIQGRGIVASRIIQRLSEVRQQTGKPIKIVHLMRSKLPGGRQFGRSRRAVKHHWEFQPFNWPKACWGGDLREILERADPQTRLNLLKSWGGTTTADRRDWQQLTEFGLHQGWYEIQFGTVQKVERSGQKLQVIYTVPGQSRQTIQEADFIIDATGLDAEVKASPLLEDLVTRYQLPLLENGRLAVTNDFEMVEMRSIVSGESPGRMYAAGTITLGGPYAAVDSFLGLQYAALRSIDSLTAAKSIGLRYLNGFSSLQQWWNWAIGRSP